MRIRYEELRPGRMLVGIRFADEGQALENRMMLPSGNPDGLPLFATILAGDGYGDMMISMASPWLNCVPLCDGEMLVRWHDGHFVDCSGAPLAFMEHCESVSGGEAAVVAHRILEILISPSDDDGERVEFIRKEFAMIAGAEVERTRSDALKLIFETLPCYFIDDMMGAAAVDGGASSPPIAGVLADTSEESRSGLLGRDGKTLLIDECLEQYLENMMPLFRAVIEGHGGVSLETMLMLLKVVAHAAADLTLDMIFRGDGRWDTGTFQITQPNVH